MEGNDIIKKIKHYNVIVITEIMNKEQLFLRNRNAEKIKVASFILRD